VATDTADISWQAPTAVLLAAGYPSGIANHNWGVPTTAATNIGHQALLSAARYLAAAIDLIEQPDRLAAIQQEFRDRTSGIK
jgi:aminobenzoyl-glutamate utilization protein B